MGETRVKFKMYGDKDQVAELEALVDTGSTFSKIPESVINKLGLQAEDEAEVELGDGRVIKRKLVQASMEIEGVRRPVPITMGEEEKPLIGCTTLEILRFKVNPVTGKLEKTRAIEYHKGLVKS